MSRVTVIDVSDPEVLALLEERERNQQYIKRCYQENEEQIQSIRIYRSRQ
ncbi:ead/Ea22-like family protein [Salmonella enterica subsp. enterica serovar Anatum]|nr:ead/Ea22-like family protein [Salmonella enterica subsp. enterica serovar Anatum]